MAIEIKTTGHVQVKTAPKGAQFAVMSNSGGFVQLFVKYGDGSQGAPYPDTLYFWGSFDNWMPLFTNPEKFVTENTFCTFEVQA